MKTKLYFSFLLLLLSAMPSVYATEYLFGYGSGKVVQINPAVIDANNVMATVSVPVAGVSSIQDMAVVSDGIYLANGTYVTKYSIDGGTKQLSISYVSTYKTVTVGTDGNIYAYNGYDLVQMSNTNLQTQTVLVSGLGGFQDISAGSLGIYTVDNSVVRLYNYSGAYQQESQVTGPSCIKVAANGLVYARTTSETVQYDPGNLATAVVIHQYAQTSEIRDFNDVPWRNNEITDIAVSLDGNYFYAADGTYIWKFNIAGGKAIARSDAGGYTKVEVANITEPAIFERVYGYTTSGSQVRLFSDRFLLGSTALVSGAGGLKAIAVGSDGLYAADGTYIHKYSLDNGNYLDTSYASTYKCVTVGTDGDVYAYNGSDLVRMSKGNLKTQTVLNSGLGGFQDLAAGALGLYTSDNSYARRYPYSGGAQADISYSQGVRVVTVGLDGYVYVRSTNQTLRYAPDNLKNFTILHEYGAASELKDFDGNPIWRSSQIVDIAVSPDGKYFYAADGTYIWKFNIGGGTAVARSDAGGYSSISVVSSPSPANFDGLGVVDYNDLSIFTNEWLSCTDPAGVGCVIAKDYTIPQGTATIDGDLTEWQDATWLPLDKNYYQTAPDVTSAVYALRWDTTKSVVYLAVEVHDSTLMFADFSTPWSTNWDESDRLEVYSQGSAAGGMYYDPNFDPVHYYAQQYVIGKGTTGSWCKFGSTDPGISPTDPNFAYAITVDQTNGIIRYEVAVPQYDTYGGILNDPYYPTVNSELTVNKNIRFDVLVGSRWGSTDANFGMLGENTLGGKYLSASAFGLYTLAGSGCGDWGYLQQDLNTDCKVDFEDFATFAEYWLEM